jgi:hypothetical protein
VSQPGPDERLCERLAHLPPDALRTLDGALERAQARARGTGGTVWVDVKFEVDACGIRAVELPTRFERLLTGHSTL